MKRLSTFILMLLVFGSTMFGQVAINPENSPPDNTAMLDVNSKDKGILIPRMTGEQRDAIRNPLEGLMVYCTDCTVNGSLDGSLSIYLSGTWKTLSLCHCSAPVAGVNTTSPGQITWNWTEVSGASGYRWNTINHYTSATEMDTSLTITETDLVPGNTYTRFVWAYNSCGISEVTILTQTLSY
jgi:hypothetical protein